MGAVPLVAICTVVVAPGEAVAPGALFEVETRAEADRLVEIGAAAIPDDVDAEGDEDGEDPV